MIASAPASITRLSFFFFVDEEEEVDLKREKMENTDCDCVVESELVNDKGVVVDDVKVVSEGVNDVVKGVRDRQPNKEKTKQQSIKLN